MPFSLPAFINRKQIDQRIADLGREIEAAYRGKDLMCVGILKGSVQFMSRLIESIDLPLEIDFVCVTSYGNKTQSSGEVKWVLDLARSIQDKHVLIVEDIIDTGVTVNTILNSFQLRKPLSIKVASLLSKPSRRKINVAIDFLGFEIEDHFVVGFGFDYQEKYRNLPHIAILPDDRIHDQ